MRKQRNTFPILAQFPSFRPSLHASPVKIQNSSFSQIFNGLSARRISIHLPQEYLDQDESQNEKQSQPFQLLHIRKIASQNYEPHLYQGFSNIKVYCRMRQSKKCQESLIKYDETMINDSENCYSFDYIFAKNALQQQVYKKIATRHIDDFFMGKNSTIFAYGQTGSGKTYTMFGSMSQPENYGIIPRTLQQIFKRDLSNSTITCSMLEIYNEKLVDLFHPLTNSHSQIKLKQFNDMVFLQGLQEILVQNQHELLNLIRMGHKGRKIAATMTNDVSSRSHTILFLYRIFQCRNQQFRTKLCFIDLAGSQKICKSGVKGQTLEETKKINLSLSCLGNVIHSLTNGSNHIPYRNSKLTRILKDSLCTDTSTSIITTCSLDQSDYNETISTIKFAVRAKKIKNKKKLAYQEEPTLEQEFIKLKQQLEQTKKQLEHYKKKQVQDQDRYENDIPEEVCNEIQPIRSICVTFHGV